MMDERTGKLYGVSVGPGDPGLLTVHAVRILQEVDCIAAPDLAGSSRAALGIVRNALGGALADKELIDCPTPMTRDRAAVARAHDAIADALAERLGAGKSVAFVTLGDASVYSTWSYVHKRMAGRGFDIEVVAGVPSFCAAAARLGEPLCEGDEQLLVVPAAAGDPAAALSVPGTKVFMKAGRGLGDLQRLLRERGVDAALVANCGREGELVVRDFPEMEDPAGYMAIVIARDRAARLSSGETRPDRPADAGLPGSSSFFQNRECPYFPCHAGVDESRFNCLFCYCPLYALGDRCGGGFRFNGAGVKDCSGCTLPHEGERGVALVKERFGELSALAGKKDAGDD